MLKVRSISSPIFRKLGLTDSEFAARILEEEKVAVVPGSAFGADGYIRLSYATSDDVIDKGPRASCPFLRETGLNERRTRLSAFLLSVFAGASVNFSKN